MSELYAMLGFTVALTFVCLPLLRDAALLRAITAIWLVSLIISAPMINEEWSRMTSVLVEEESNPHYGLPDIWEDKQVVCIHFPDNATHLEFVEGRHHVDSDGSEFLIDKNSNSTGVCIGGFTGYDTGFSLFIDASNIAADNLEIEYTESDWGILITSIGGLNPGAEWGNAYWALYHNGALSTIGISELVLEDDSVILWRVETW